MILRKFRKDVKKLRLEKLKSLEDSLKSLDKSVLYIDEQLRTLRNKNLSCMDYNYQQDFLNRKMDKLEYERKVVLKEIDKLKREESL